MNIKKLFLKVLPFKSWKKKFYVELLDTIETLEMDFNSPVKSFHAVVGALYDCVSDVPVVALTDFKLYKAIDVNLFTKSSQEASQFVSRVLKKDIRYINYMEDNDVLVRTRLIDWFSNEESLQSYLDDGLDIIALYVHYHNALGNGVSENKEPTSEILVKYFEHINFKMFISEYFAIYKVVIETNVRNL